MRFERHGVSTRPNGWKCSTIYSDDLKIWYLGDGTKLSDDDMREDSLASEFIAVILILFFFLIIFFVLV